MKKLKTFLLLALTGLSMFTYAQIPTNGMIGYYPFNNNANDASGNNLNGTVNGAVLTTDRFGNANSAYSFDGTDDNINCGTSNIYGINTIAISVWFLEDTYPTSTNSHAIVSKSSEAAGEVGFRVEGSFDQNSYLVWSRMGTPQAGDGAIGTTSATTLGVWHHVVAMKSNDTIYLYRDNVSQGYTTGITLPFNNNNPFLIGALTENIGTVYFFDGKIDDIRVYNRRLSIAEISALYNESSPCTTADITTGLIAHYPFTGNANDVSGNGYNGNVNTGATLTTDRFGNANSAYSFNGSTQGFINIPNSGSIDFSNGISFSAWFQASSSAMSSLVDKMEMSGSNGFRINTRDVSEQNKIWACAGNYNSGIGTAISTTQYSIGTWYNVVGTFGPSNQVNIYINGILENTYNASYSFNNTSEIFIGKGHHTSGYEFFNGKIDDISIYNRALNPCDIDSIYNLCAQPSQAATPTGTTQLCINPSNTTYTTTGATNATAYIWEILPSSAGTITGTVTTATVNWDNTYTGTATIHVKGTNGVGCEGVYSNDISVTVNALPNVSFTGLNANYCINASAVTLSGTPTGGTFSGNGISGNIFTPSVAGLGTHSITYTVTVSGYTTTLSQNVTVYTIPTVR